MTNFYAESERINSDAIVDRLLEDVSRCPRAGCSHASRRARTAVPRSRGRRAPRHARAEGAHDRRRASSPACTAARSRASASSSPSTASTSPATISPTIDWKVYARSDRYYVKKFEEETNLDCHLLLDVSGSMGYGSARHHASSSTAQCLAASLGLPDEPAARRRRPDRVRRAHRDACCRRARGPATCARCCSRSIGCSSGARPTSRSRCTSSPTRSPSAAWSCSSRICSTIPSASSAG